MSWTRSLRRLGGMRLAAGRAFSSALFVSDRSPNVRPILSPSLNLTEKFENVEKLQNNLDVRGINVNAADLKTLWQGFVDLNEVKNKLENQRVEIAAEIKKLKKSKNPGDLEKVEGRILHGRIVREDLKKLMPPFWDTEERLMLACLALPNSLHEDTPLAEDKVIFQTTTLADDLQSADHLVIGKHLIDYRDPHWYYLTGSAAHFDAATMYYFLENFKSNHFLPVVSPDFCHTAVAEGCEVNTDDVIRLQAEDNINIVGGASIFPFCTLYAKQDIPVGSLPVKLVVAGKKYLLSDKPGLFGTWQRTRVEFFQIASDTNEINKQFNETLELLKRLYQDLGWSFKIVLIPATKLRPWESLRASFQMFSPLLQSFVEVGNVSLSGTFVSERLSMRFVEKDGQKRFSHVVSGSAVDGTSVLACLLEQNVSDLLSKPLTAYTFNFL